MEQRSMKDRKNLPGEAAISYGMSRTKQKEKYKSNTKPCAIGYIKDCPSWARWYSSRHPNGSSILKRKQISVEARALEMSSRPTDVALESS